MNKIIVPAPAKINLALDILDKRDDGFHEVEMIMQSIALHDIVDIEKRESGIRLEVLNSDLPNDENNIAYRAARLILDKSGLQKGVNIKIHKNIPVAAGLAGGSTDAAAVLTGINILYDLNLSKSQLYSLAAELGSDVPFCIDGGTALAYGRGEKIRQLADIIPYWIIVVNPGIEISTAQVYHKIDDIEIEERSDIKKLLNIIEEKRDIKWNEGWKNVLEKVVLSDYQEISAIKQLLIKMGANFSLMSGSGSSVFAVVSDKKKAVDIKKNWPREQDFFLLTKTVKKGFLELWRKYL